jgi:hypothetical protein
MFTVALRDGQWAIGKGLLLKIEDNDYYKRSTKYEQLLTNIN